MEADTPGGSRLVTGTNPTSNPTVSQAVVVQRLSHSGCPSNSQAVSSVQCQIEIVLQWLAPAGLNIVGPLDRLLSQQD